MKKLYFISYDGGSVPAYGNYWASGEREAVALFCGDYKLEYQSLNRDNFICYTVDDAINGRDILEAINRYIIKPIKRQ